MPKEFNADSDPDRRDVYQIRIKGHLGSHWSDWFEGMDFNEEEDGELIMSGHVVDQTALHGLLKKVRDLGLPLISIARIEPGRSDTSDDTQ